MPAPQHPGAELKRRLTKHKVSPYRASRDLDIDPMRINRLLKQGPLGITPDTAMRLGIYFGTGAWYWMELQARYDLALQETDKAKDIAVRVKPLVRDR